MVFGESRMDGQRHERRLSEVLRGDVPFKLKVEGLEFVETSLHFVVSLFFLYHKKYQNT